MDIQLSQDSRTDTIICPLAEPNPDLSLLTGIDIQERMLKAESITWFYGRGGEPHIVIVGLGASDRLNMETVRRAAGTAGRSVQQHECARVTVSFDGIKPWLGGDEQRWADVVGAWTEGWLLGTYRFDKYKSDKKKSHVRELIFDMAATSAAEEALKRARIRAKGTTLARNLANEPGNGLRPLDLAERASTQLSGLGIEVEVYEQKRLESLRMNGLLAVGRGSENPPVMIRMTYRGKEAEQKPIALVGKGITFDTGGISLKKSRDMSDMRLDMSGAAAVIGAMQIIAESGLKANVTALVAAAENVPDGKALLPGDVITYSNGTTVQIGNTDAEGRLVLADALIHAHALGASEAVDIATLTGACVVSLGTKIAGVWGDDDLVATLKRASESSGDKIWHMPLEEEYEELLKSAYADTSNIGKGSYAGAITAALFLKKFVHPDMRWAHVDMAGPMEATSDSGYTPKGATGFGARLLADYVQLRTNSHA